MRIRWWRSIRFRLALASVVIALLAIILLALVTTIASVYYYGNDQSTRLKNFADDKTQQMGTAFINSGDVRVAARTAFPSTNPVVVSTQGDEYLPLVLNKLNKPVYPGTAMVSSIELFNQLTLALRNPSYNPNTANSALNSMVKAVIDAQSGFTTTGEIGQSRLGYPVRPFVAEPIVVNETNGHQVIAGVLFVTPRYAVENTLPSFLLAVRQSVFIVAGIVAVLTVLFAILISRTITRPLAKLTKTARELTAGDYSARVNTRAKDELGELAQTFNEMAAQLEKDVSELHRQELWRRELIMNITHDLATPLTAITGLSESLVDGVNRNREDYEATGRIIVRETLRLRRLVKDLHMMAKVEAGALHPLCKPVRLTSLVDDVLAMLTVEFERVDVEPRNAIPYTFPMAFADPDMLSRVFANLCDNALRHTPRGGVVLIEARQFNDKIAVAVTDTGEGIPTEALDRVFERFYRADSARQTKTGGSGLGLAIVRAMVEAHGGTIWAENVPGAGARFIFTLPVAPAGSTRILSGDTTALR